MFNICFLDLLNDNKGGIYLRKDILNALKTVPFKEVSIGYRTVILFSPEELENKQIGYSVDSVGQSLVGDKNGDWQSSWIVIGYEDEMGDPIFVDTSEEGFSVYTAVHGEGEWEQEMISTSFHHFILSLNHMKEISVGRENPVALENNPISFEEKKHILKLISNINVETDLYFWESWLEFE